VGSTTTARASLSKMKRMGAFPSFHFDLIHSRTGEGNASRCALSRGGWGQISFPIAHPTGSPLYSMKHIPIQQASRRFYDESSWPVDRSQAGCDRHRP
jgi:hypothetical protein